MIFTQYYLDCLSQASYLIGDETSRQAVVVDPRRDVAEYLTDAHAHGLQIVGVIDTHFHADFLAGHLELAAAATGAWIGFGTRANAEFPVRHLADGERIELGEVVLQTWETPGHTPESISVLVYEHAGDEVPYGVLTGDALFIGDVGRPDLLASIGHTADELGRMLYASVHRLMTLTTTIPPGVPTSSPASGPFPRGERPVGDGPGLLRASGCSGCRRTSRPRRAARRRRSRELDRRADPPHACRRGFPSLRPG